MTTRNISSSHLPLPFADGSRTDTVAFCATCMQSVVVAPKFRRWFVCSASLEASISHQNNGEAKQILVMLFSCSHTLRLATHTGTRRHFSNTLLADMVGLRTL